MSIISSITPIIEKGIKPVVEGRYSTEAGKIARQLNKIAINGTKGDRMVYTFPNATPEDLKRLTSKSMKDSYKRVTWTNPKDNKVYHILEEGRTKDKVQVRILDKDGGVVKNAELEPLNIVVFDNFYSPRGFTHGEMMETFVKRFNPFANVERLAHKKNIYEILKYRGKLPMHLEIKRFKELESKMDKGKKVDFISVSEVHLMDASDVIKKGGKIQRDYMAQSPYIEELEPIFKKIMSTGTRILEAAGNEPRCSKFVVSDRLAIEGVEGVGSLRRGKIAGDSCSRNSVFTQHYEQRDFSPVLSRDIDGSVLGINVTGLPGTDIPLNWKTKRMVGHKLGGTSYSTPIRVAKLSLNQMMEKAGL